ncbi:MAG: aminotransferase class I/II-fold pyridoxal phosphate-dependent enzyme, partial [Bacteroidota bacterium]
MNSTSMHTQCVHSGQEADLLHGETVSAIYPGSSYAYLDRDLKAYPRYFNTPNQRAVAQKVAALEAAEAGLITSSGMAAISNTLLAFLKQGDHLVMQYGLYGGTTHFIQEHFPRQGIHFSQAKDGSLAALEAEIRPETKVIYIETPSNPLLAITDVAA